MGGIGIWCMHFIGNRAIDMSEAQPDKQIVYQNSFTSVSFFLSIVVSSGAFYLLGATERINRYFISFAGVSMGLAMGGMHYIGQLAISNYRCSYSVANAVGTAIISVAASMIVLNVFFRVREVWTDTWWKRVLCGLVFACSVSGMHWTATVATWYGFKGLESTPADPLSRKQTVIVCTTLVRHLHTQCGNSSEIQSVPCNLSPISRCLDRRLQEEKMQEPISKFSSCVRLLR